MPVWLLNPKNLALIGLAAALAFTTGAWRLTAAHLDTALAERDAALQRVENLAGEVRAAQAVVLEAKAINGRQADAIERHRKALSAALAALSDQEKATAARDAQVRSLAAQVRQADRERRALPSVPVEVMNEALRDAAAGL